MIKVMLENVSYHIKDDVIFNRLDYDFHQGTFTLLRGDSGSGKSTLLRLIAGFSGMSHGGNILIDGMSQSSRSIAEKVQQVGMVFQKPNQQFTMRTLRREIIFALENLSFDYGEIQTKMKQAVALTKTEEFLDRDLISLSGGEKQRASLTVLLAMDAPILLLDEPFASVDEASRYELIHLLGQLRDLGKTIILCDHDLSGYRGVVDDLITLSQTGLTRESLSILDVQESVVLSKSHDTSSSLLKLSNVSYGSGGKQLLLPTSYDFEQGITTLTGDNGVGKSTLLNAIVQQHRYQGKMYLNDKRMKKNKGLYQRITLAVQEASHQFVQLTPKEELMYHVALSDSQKKKQQEMLEALGLLNKLNGSLFHLSEGQKKMIQLISLLSLDREILLMDEPFTGLDERACQLFMDWMKEKSQSQSFVIVSHRLAPLSGNSDYHVTLKNQTLNFVGETFLKEEEQHGYCQNKLA